MHFYTYILYHLKNQYLTINDKIIREQRNGFIHKGIIPNKEEAEKFCEMIYSEISNLHKKLSEDNQYNDSILKLTHQLIQQRHPNKNIQTSICLDNSFFNIMDANQKYNFYEDLEKLKMSINYDKKITP